MQIAGLWRNPYLLLEWIFFLDKGIVKQVYVYLFLKVPRPKLIMQVLNCNRQWKSVSLRDSFALFYLGHLMGIP